MPAQTVKNMDNLGVAYVYRVLITRCSMFYDQSQDASVHVNILSDRFLSIKNILA